MFELSVANAADYLSSKGIAAPSSVTELGGGVSNTVLLVETPPDRFILKQSLGKLRVEQDWFSDRDRIFRESSAMRQLGACLPSGGVPTIFWEDRDNRLFAMSAAPADARTWKAQLMAGTVEAATAARIGEMLAAIIRCTWRDAESEREFGDQTVFDQLRLDPYYRSTADRHPDLAPHFNRLMRLSASRRVCLVHGDWSPKNFLVRDGGVMAIDFEVIHYGDPSFDAAFLLNHLVLKSFHLPRDREALAGAAEAFWKALQAGMPAEADWFEAATVEHLGALMLARVDGKSPAEYLDNDRRGLVRAFARRLILSPPGRAMDVFERA